LNRIFENPSQARFSVRIVLSDPTIRPGRH
jgi:hypothetical protein